MIQIGFSLVNLTASAEVQHFTAIPPRIDYEAGGVRVDGMALGGSIIGLDGNTYGVVERWYDDAAQPGTDQKKVGESAAFDGTRVNVSPVFGAMTAQEIADRDAEAAEATRLATFKADGSRAELIEQLSTATAAQITTWVNNNATNLAGARVILATIIKVLALIVRR